MDSASDRDAKANGSGDSHRGTPNHHTSMNIQQAQQVQQAQQQHAQAAAAAALGLLDPSALFGKKKSIISFV